MSSCSCGYSPFRSHTTAYCEAGLSYFFNDDRKVGKIRGTKFWQMNKKCCLAIIILAFQHLQLNISRPTLILAQHLANFLQIHHILPHPILHVRYTVKPSSQYCRTAHSFRVAVAYHTASIELSSILTLNARHDATAVRLLGTRTRLYRCAMAPKKPCRAVVWQYCELGLIHHCMRTHTCCCIYKLMFIY